MTLTSALPGVYAALVDGLPGVSALSGVDVTWGIPAGAAAREWIRLDDAVADQTTATLNPARRPRDEDGDVNLVVSVMRSSGAAREASERAFALAGEVEKYLRADPQLGGAVTWALITRISHDQRADGDNRQAEVTLTITTRARVQGP